jgi:hypothetical protein
MKSISSSIFTLTLIVMFAGCATAPGQRNYWTNDLKSTRDIGALEQTENGAFVARFENWSVGLTNVNPQALGPKPLAGYNKHMGKIIAPLAGLGIGAAAGGGKGAAIGAGSGLAVGAVTDEVRAQNRAGNTIAADQLVGGIDGQQYVVHSDWTVTRATPGITVAPLQQPAALIQPIPVPAHPQQPLYVPVQPK